MAPRTKSARLAGLVVAVLTVAGLAGTMVNHSRSHSYDPAKQVVGS